MKQSPAHTSSFLPHPTRSIWQRLFSVFLPVIAAGSLHAGTHTWSGAGANTLWSNAANWSSGGAPVSGESNVVLIFPSNATGFTSTQNVSNLSVDRIEISKPSTNVPYTFPNSGTGLTLTGVAGDNIWLKDSVSVVWQPSLNLQNTCRFNLASFNGIFATLDIQGFVGGSGGIVKQGVGVLEFSTGGAANTFTGTFRVESGLVDLNKIVGTPCFGGNLQIIGGTVTVRRSHQIPDTATITIGDGALYATADSGVASVTEKIGPVIFNGPTSMFNLRVSSPNTIILGGSVSCAAGSTVQARMVADGPSGKFALDGTSPVFTVPDATSEIDIQGDIADNATASGFTKQGAGKLIIRSATTFTGAVTVAAGTLRLANNQSLGGTAGATTVQTGATLELGHATEGITLPAGETINLTGTLSSYQTSTVNGSIVCSGVPTITVAPGKVLTHTGVLSGSGAPLTVAGFGTLLMAGTASNTMSGSISVSGNLHLNKTNTNAIPGTVRLSKGTVKLLAPNQIADAGSVMIDPNGVFDLNSHNETISFLFGPCTSISYVMLGDATLTLNGTSNVQLGTAAAPSHVQITGSATSKIRKLGTGTWTLYQENPTVATYPTLSVEGGTVELYVEWPGNIECKGGLLRGKATTGAITGMGGQICLCDFTATSFSGSATVRVGINGGTPGTGFDRLICHGPVNLTGQTLSLTLGDFMPMTFGRFTIIDRNLGDGVVTGTFNSLPEGANFMLNGLRFSITYKGGTYANDVQLIFLGTGTPAPEITSITKVGNSTTITVTWLPSMAGKQVSIQRAEGSGQNILTIWGGLKTVTLNAQGQATHTYNEFQTSAFYRLTTDY